MRSLHEYSISAWLTIGMLIVFLPLCFITTPETESSTFYFMRDFSLTDFIICLFFGCACVFNGTSRTKAVHYEESAKLAVLNYFQSIIQLCFDVLFLNTPFTLQQIAGVLIVIGANSVKWGLTIRRLFFTQAK